LNIEKNKVESGWEFKDVAKDALDDFTGAISDFTKAHQLDTNDVFVFVERSKSFMNLNNSLYNLLIPKIFSFN
jgi:hypothetical protein